MSTDAGAVRLCTCGCLEDLHQRGGRGPCELCPDCPTFTYDPEATEAYRGHLDDEEEDEA